MKERASNVSLSNSVYIRVNYDPDWITHKHVDCDTNIFTQIILLLRNLDDSVNSLFFNLQM